MKGTRWRNDDTDINGLATAQNELHKRLWKREESNESSEGVQFINNPLHSGKSIDMMTNAATNNRGFMFRHMQAE